MMHSTFEDLLAALARGPSVVGSLVAMFRPGLETWREGEGRWNGLEVLSHLADGEITDWMPRVQMILSGGGRFTPFDREAGFERYRGWSAAAVAEEFGRLRRVNLQRLGDAGIGPKHLELTGEHAEFGRVTLGQLLATWATHDMAHAAQLSRILTRSFGRDVGPWAAHFSLLAS